MSKFLFGLKDYKLYLDFKKTFKKGTKLNSFERKLLLKKIKKRLIKI